MRHTATRSSRSSQHHPRSSPVPNSPTTSSVFQQPQQPQQQILYAPISKPTMTLQPCGTALHPSCVYPTVQPHVDSSNSAAIHLQGKSNQWLDNTKGKPSCSQQHYQQQQQQLSYSKPMMLLDQTANNVPTAVPPPSKSFLVASSTFTHGPLPGEHYSNASGMTHLLPQPYFKLPDMQQTCLIQDRQNAQQQQPQQHPVQASYYNISAPNVCSLQTLNARSSFPLANVSPYASLTPFTGNQFPASVQSSSLLPSSPVGLLFAPRKPLPLFTLEFPSFKHNASKTPSIPVGNHNETIGSSWPPQFEASSKDSYDPQATGNDLESADCPLQKAASTVAKTDEEHYSDASSASFDFTIEAEKMVSALCNTTSSNDLNKEESKAAKTDSAQLFSGAGDNVSNKTTWFADFCSEYENITSIGVQTDGPCVDRSQYPELIRKTAYWACTEAEVALGSDDSQTDPKRYRLTRLSSATKTAITKSSTCIPVFAGDRVFVDDLVNALLRISNGWLSLDNYLNKQHLPNLLDRLDPELVACFHTWEESTHELLKQIARTFGKFGENDEASDVERKRKETCGSSSFPGDVTHYVTNCDLFVPLPASSLLRRDATEKASSQEIPRNPTTVPLSSSLRGLQCNSAQQEQHSASHKECKLRSKWTITEDPPSAINGTKSVPDISVCHTDGAASLTSNKFRAKDSTKRFDLTQKSLNAEFCRLRNQVSESNADATKDRRLDYVSENKLSMYSDHNTEYMGLRSPAMSNRMSYRGLYAQNCVSLAFPAPGQSDSSYLAPNPGILAYGGPSHPLSTNPCSIGDFRGGRTPEQLYGNKSATASPVHAGRSQVDPIELPTVPKNKVTLLSQIEPRTLDKESKEMAANLSAWFASMRNAQLPPTVSTLEEARLSENTAQRLLAQREMPKYSGALKQPQMDANRQFQALQNLPNIQSTPWAAAGNFVSGRPRAQRVPEEYDSSEDVRVYMKPGSYNVPKKRHQRRPNRRSDNSATSRNVHASSQHNVCGGKTKNASVPASSTPLSHFNVPTLSANVGNGTLIKTSFPSASQLPAPLFNPENSPSILKRSESLSQDAHRDVTWKAACASAEILLEALNVKDGANTSKKIDRDCSTGKDDKNEDNARALPSTSQRGDPKSTKRTDADSSYEASEDDSDSTCRLSLSASVMSIPQSCDNENALSTKINVKTDSWLIRTLNNASIVGKQKRRKDSVDRCSSESSNSSVIADVKPNQIASSSIADSKVPAPMIDSEYPAIISREHISCSFPVNDETLMKESEGHVGRATYSETVRRSMKSDNAHSSSKESYKACVNSNASVTCSTAVPIPGRKCQKKDPEQSYQLLHKSQRSTAKRSARNTDSNDLKLEEGSCAKSSNVTPKLSSATRTYGKKKDSEHSESKCQNKSGDRGWSVWYSSKRKQSLSPLALSKLEMIHRAVWQMDEAKIFKYPISCGYKVGQLVSAETIENYCKTVKSPMFLEIVDYKLKNRVYHKVEHAVRDFRRIIHCARLYHQHDDERTKKIEALSKRLEDLLEEHFGNWDFGGITGSPREDVTAQVRCKIPGQKSITGRCDSAKKGTTSLTIAEENTSLH